MTARRFQKSCLVALIAGAPFLACGFLEPVASAAEVKTPPAAQKNNADDKKSTETQAEGWQAKTVKDKDKDKDKGKGKDSDAEEAPPPWTGIRSFLRSHDRIVIGDTKASSALNLLRQDQAKLFENIPPEAWDDASMRQAAAIYVLAGGSVAVLKPAMASKQLQPKEDQLLKGITAYGSGHTGDAEALLTPLNALDYTPTLGGHLALAQAILITKTDPKKALDFLNTARLLMPGTLVEEAALRHTLAVAAKMGDRDSFLFAAGSYFRRFPNSSYASMFRRQLVVLLIQWPHGDNMQLLKDIATAIPSDNELGSGFMLIAVAEQATYAGNISLARVAIDSALPYYQTDSDTRQRLLLYHAITMILSDQLEAGLNQLQRINATRLRQADAQLYVTAADLARRLHEEPRAKNISAETIKAAVSQEDGTHMFPMSTTRKHAMDLLAETNTILERAK